MPPGYVRRRPADKLKRSLLIPVVEAILEADRAAPVKHRHTANGFSSGCGTSMDSQAACGWICADVRSDFDRRGCALSRAASVLG
jgi:hypothetical protein